MFDDATLDWVVEEFNMNIGLVFIKQQAIDKRLKGLRWLRRPLSYVTAKERKGFSFGSFARKALIGDDGDGSKRLIPAEKVVHWLVQNKIAELLSTLVDYPELIRQGMPLLVFVADREPSKLPMAPISVMFARFKKMVGPG